MYRKYKLENKLERRIIDEIDTWKISFRDQKDPKKAKSLLYGIGIEAAKRIYTKAEMVQKIEFSDNIDFSKFSLKEATREFIRGYLLLQLKTNNHIPEKAADASGMTFDGFKYHMKISEIRIREIKKSFYKTNNTFSPVEVVELVINSYYGCFRDSLHTLVAYNTQLIADTQLIASRISDVVGDIIQDSNPNSESGLYFKDDYKKLNFNDAKNEFKKDYLIHLINKHYCNDLRPVVEAIGVNYSLAGVTLNREGIKLKDILSEQV